MKDYKLIFESINWKDTIKTNFNSEYFNGLISYIMNPDNRNNWYSLTDKNGIQVIEGKVLKLLTNDYDRIIKYLKYYIDLKITDKDFPEISFSDCFTKLYVH